MTDTNKQLRMRVYQQGLLVNKLRSEIYQQIESTKDLQDELDQAENVLFELEQQLVDSHNPSESNLLSYKTPGSTGLTLGIQSTGLSAEVNLRMAQVPTAIYHLFKTAEDPLLSGDVTNHDDKIRRISVSSFIEAFSAKAVNTFELAPGSTQAFQQSPTLFRWQIENLSELSQATLHITIEDLDNKIIEIHNTNPIWLLARTTAPLAVRDPYTGSLRDLSYYLGAFVTPNSPTLMNFLRSAARRHPEGRLIGYQGDQSSVAPQVKALFEALKQEADLTYINSIISFSPEQGMANQRVRLPRESLHDKQANCIDGAVLFASLLEAISLSPAIVIVPGHAFVAWETWKDAPEDWQYLETTMIGTHSFEEAQRSAQAMAARYQALAEKTGTESVFRLLPLRLLRSERNIMPME
jgi:hypothetical protein